MKVDPTTLVVLYLGAGDHFKLPCGFGLSDVNSIPCPCGNKDHWLIKNESKKIDVVYLSILAPCNNHNDRQATKIFTYGDPENLRVMYLCDECASKCEVSKCQQ